jgi:hypothetical protein
MSDTKEYRMYMGIADSEGLDSFGLIGEGTEKSPLKMRCRITIHRHPLIFQVKMDKADADYIRHITNN